MRTALLLSGQLRDVSKCYRSIFDNIISPNSADVFISTWSNSNSIVSHTGQSEQDDISIDELVKMYSPKVLDLEWFGGSDIKNYVELFASNIEEKKAYQETKVSNMLFMFYKVWKSNSILHSYMSSSSTKYDLIIRGRLDLEVTQPIPNVVEASSNPTVLYVPNGVDHRGGLFDPFAYGTPEVMDAYCSLWNDIHIHIANGAPIHPESLLKYHIDKHDWIKIERVPINIYHRGNIISGNG